ncbi:MULTISPECIES: DUF1415 domain-containing protein [unclassified Caballeronia]|uniref:DUF1415 domain-containing protein n=1 Tax=unclassified Caballeronia TaxID=2646786 RepID=UPI002865C593|nr:MULTISPECIES: DUF1415 domain-containing protein [unclassified Caballeronia]MDR5737402.1 DUF1415 domain-containing protein [Caballeronia sp. LZ016]MDR5810069.1 DUF1415 domain-containing protein [Caballeronia sp. LZ019]
MMDASTRDDVIAVTQHWLTRAVIGLNLCPFAKSVHVKGQIRYVVSEARGVEDIVVELADELRLLRDSDPEAVDTTLLITPHAFADFIDYNDALFFADRLLNDMGLAGELQIASFHPHYRFEGTEPDDIDNYTNRAPYPIFHLLREASIDRAVAAFPDAADIYERNIETLRRLGHEGFRAWMDKR